MFTPEFVCFKLTFTHFSLFSAQLLPSDKPWVQTGDSDVLSDSAAAVSVVAGCLREVCQGKKDSSAWIKRPKLGEGGCLRATNNIQDICVLACSCHVRGESRRRREGKGGEGRGGDPLLHQSQKRKARAGVKRSVLRDLEDVPESAGTHGGATPSDLFIRFD